MRKTYSIFTAVIFLLLGCDLFGASISVSIYQNDGIGKKVQNASVLFESKILDQFFDCGYIVSSEPVYFEQEQHIAYQFALDSSAKGYIEYLVFYQLNIDPILLTAVSAEWSLIDVRENLKLGSGFIEFNQTAEPNDIEKNYRVFTAGAAAPVIRLLSRK